MALDTQENEVKASENMSEKACIPLSDYANKIQRSRNVTSKKYQQLGSILC